MYNFCVPRHFEFDAEKGIEAVLYLAERLQSPTLHSVSKLLYFADQAHLRNYGRFICGDRYVAMQHGPVPSGIYDMLKWRREGTGWHHQQADKLERALGIDQGRDIRPLRKANIDLLSQSDVEALDWAIAKYGKMSFGQLTTESHDNAWRSAEDNDMIELAAIVELQPNAKELREHLELDADA